MIIFHQSISAYEYKIIFDNKSMKTCKSEQEKKEKLDLGSFSKCKTRCDEDHNCRFMRYSAVDQLCYNFPSCNEHQDASEGITYYKQGLFKK